MTEWIQWNMISIAHPQTTFAALFLTLTSYFTSLTLFLTLPYHLQEPLVIKQTISLSFYHIFFFANAVLHSWRFPLHPPPSLSSLIFLKFVYQKTTDSTTPLSGNSNLSGQSGALRTSSLRSSTGDYNRTSTQEMLEEWHSHTTSRNCHAYS